MLYLSNDVKKYADKVITLRWVSEYLCEETN